MPGATGSVLAPSSNALCYDSLHTNGINCFRPFEVVGLQTLLQSGSARIELPNASQTARPHKEVAACLRGLWNEFTLLGWRQSILGWRPSLRVTRFLFMYQFVTSKNPWNTFDQRRSEANTVHREAFHESEEAIAKRSMWRVTVWTAMWRNLIAVASNLIAMASRSFSLITRLSFLHVYS